MRVRFRRIFIDRDAGVVGVEVGPGDCYALPNPLPDGRRYDPEAMVPRVRGAGDFDMSLWDPFTERP